MIKFKLLIILISILCCHGITIAQNWQSIGGLDRVPRCMYEDTTENVLYIGGEFFVAGTDTVAGIAKWDGNRFYPLGCGLNWGCDTFYNFDNYGVIVYAITKYNNEIYVSGDFRKAGNIPVNYIARWNGANWDSVGHGLQWPASMLTVIDNELYVGGASDSAGGIHVNSLAKWNGSQWSDVHAFPNLWSSPNQNYVFTVAQYQGELYVGGNFDNDSVQDLVKYNGSEWQKVGEGLHGSMASVVNMVVYNNELYISGTFYRIQGNVGNFIQRWDGTQWKDVGGGTTYELDNPYSNGQIHDMIVHNNELYIGGVFMYAGGVPAQDVAKWNGTEWCGLGGSFDNIASTLGFCKDTLYIGGGFITMDGDSMNYVAKWTGGSYVSDCGNTSDIEQEQAEEQKFIIYPNPFHTTATLQLPYDFKNGTLLIYDIIGQKVKQLDNLQGKEIRISREGLDNGMYFFKVIDGKASIGQGKMVVE